MDTKHSYKYFPAQDPWTWEQEGEYGSERESGGRARQEDLGQGQSGCEVGRVSG